MLARVAENLYWLGRHIERAECSTRYLKVQFFSTLDAPMVQHKDFVLRSIWFMSGDPTINISSLDESEVWQHVIFSSANTNSIFSSIKMARENARGIRNVISEELWESINKWYIYCIERQNKKFVLADIFEFSEQMRFFIANIKYSMVNTILHDNVWRFLNLGLMLERTLQVTKILTGKISDYTILSDRGNIKSIKLYQWTVLLKSLGAFDVHQHYNGSRLMSHESIFTLILSNKLFPRSIGYSTEKIYKHLKQISEKPLNYDIIVAEYKSELDRIDDFTEFADEDLVIQQLEEIRYWIEQFHIKVQALFFQ